KLKYSLIFTFFITTMINTLLEIFREIFIITKQQPSSIYFIKLFLTFPLIFGFMLIVQKSLSKYSLSVIYNFLTIIYVIFFILLGSLLLPNENLVQKGQVWVEEYVISVKLEEKRLKFLEPILYIYGEWIYTAIYVAAEMYGTFMIGLFYFTFANSLCTKAEMEDIFPYLSSTSAISMIISALLYMLFDFIKQRVSDDTSMMITSLLFITLSCLTLLIYFMNKMMEKNFKKSLETVYIPNKTTSNIWKLLESRLLRNISIILLVYSFSSGILDATWKNSLSDASKRYNIPTDKYSSVFVSVNYTLIPLSILIVNIFMYKYVIKLGWLFSSLITPLLSISTFTLISCLSFYNYPTETEKGFMFNDFLKKMPKFLDFENWTITISIVLIKICKFVNFDMAKEMISMRIPESKRGKYKSVYDGICIKLGKSLSAFYGAFFTVLEIPNLKKVAPITLALIVITNAYWIKAVLYVNKKFQECQEKNTEFD
ncbi:ADP,ATP carrier protein 1, partial [Nosema bombycis CQ1]